MEIFNQPLALSSRVTLLNRVVVPPMASGTATAEGFVTEETLAHYRRLSTSGAGLVMVEYSFIHGSGRSEERQLGADCDDKLEGLKRLAMNIAESGAVPALQLVHAGGKSESRLTGGPLISPSGIVVPNKGLSLEVPDVAQAQDLSLLRKSFVAAALRAQSAGFPIVEFHAAHGYGLNQWLSPVTNQREDAYGGSVFNRARLLFEIISEVRTRAPDLLLSVRFPGQDHFEGGHTSEDSVVIAGELERLGVSILNVSSGIGGWRRPGVRSGEGYLVPDAEVIQARVRIPVIGVGGISTAEFIGDGISRQRFSLAAVGRAILQDPGWGARVGLRR